MLAGYHRIWNNAVAVRHPSLWTFIRCIKDQQSAIENSVEAVDNGEPTIKRRKKWRDLEDRFLRCGTNITTESAMLGSTGTLLPMESSNSDVTDHLFFV